MMIVSGKCAKCGRTISSGGVPVPIYSEVEIDTDAGEVIVVGICSLCRIEQLDLDELEKAVRDVMPNVNFGKFSSVRGVKRYADIIAELQGGNCALCGKPLGDRYVMNAGRLIHEVCADIEKEETIELKRNESAGKGGSMPAKKEGK